MNRPSSDATACNMPSPRPRSLRSACVTLALACFAIGVLAANFVAFSNELTYREGGHSGGDAVLQSTASVGVATSMPPPSPPGQISGAKIFIVPISPILGNLSALEVLARLSARGHNATTRRLAHVTSRAYEARSVPPLSPGAASKPSMKCDYHDASCSLRAYTHEEVIVSQLRQSPHVTDDPTRADFLLVPLPATLYYLYLRDIGKHTCPDCELLEQTLDSFFAGGGAGDEVARRWAGRSSGGGGSSGGESSGGGSSGGGGGGGGESSGGGSSGCGRNSFVFMSLRCPSTDGRTMLNKGWRSLFSPYHEPVSGIHVCIEPAEPPPSAHAAKQGLRERLSPSSLAFHTLSVPFLEWDDSLTRPQKVEQRMITDWARRTSVYL
jgi:hypothetical protein